MHMTMFQLLLYEYIVVDMNNRPSLHGNILKNI